MGVSSVCWAGQRVPKGPGEPGNREEGTLFLHPDPFLEPQCVPVCGGRSNLA